MSNPRAPSINTIILTFQFYAISFLFAVHWWFNRFFIPVTSVCGGDVYATPIFALEQLVQACALTILFAIRRFSKIQGFQIFKNFPIQSGAGFINKCSAFLQIYICSVVPYTVYLDKIWIKIFTTLLFYVLNRYNHKTKLHYLKH